MQKYKNHCNHLYFSVQPGSDPGIFSISSGDISTITLVGYNAFILIAILHFDNVWLLQCSYSKNAHNKKKKLSATISTSWSEHTYVRTRLASQRVLWSTSTTWGSMAMSGPSHRLRGRSVNVVLRQHYSHLIPLTQIWISRDWTGYHAWEDGRGNYAWDIGALNTNMMSYSVIFASKSSSWYITLYTIHAYTGPGAAEHKLCSLGKECSTPDGWHCCHCCWKGQYLKMTSPGTSWNLQEVDNTPDMDAAVDLEDNVGGESDHFGKDELKKLSR